MLKKAILILTLIYTSVLGTVSLIRLDNVPNIGVSFGDKIFHFLAYGVLAFLWFNTFFFKFKLKRKRAIFLAVILSLIFGIIIELLQDTMTNERALDVYDIVANTLGVLLVSTMLWFKKVYTLKTLEHLFF